MRSCSDASQRTAAGTYWGGSLPWPDVCKAYWTMFGTLLAKVIVGDEVLASVLANPGLDGEASRGELRPRRGWPTNRGSDVMFGHLAGGFRVNDPR
jgi:hypothetical protein